VLIDNEAYYFEVDELHLTGAARLIIEQPSSMNESAVGPTDELGRVGKLLSFVVHKFLGDKTGKMHIRHNQAGFPGFFFL